MISLRAELPDKEDDYVQRNCRQRLAGQSIKNPLDIVRRGR
jgi:hypothetical protein